MKIDTSIPAPGSKTIVYAHRGAMSYAPQNTMKAFSMAWEQGAHGIELDVQTTSDGVPVVFHDDTLDQLTDGEGPVRGYDLAGIRKLDAGSHFGPAFAGERIPTLEEVLRAMPAESFINIEIKTDLAFDSSWLGVRVRHVFGAKPLERNAADPREIEARRVVRSTVDCLERVAEDIPELPSRVIVSSFDPIALEAFAEVFPGIPVAFLYAPNVVRDTRPLMRSIPHQAWHPHFKLVGAKTLAEERAAGRRVNVWTVNEEDEARRLIALGVDGLITNKPDILLKLLA